MPRRLRLFAAAGALLLAAGSAAVASAATERETELCQRYAAADVKNGRYTVMNNVWGATTAQCINVASDGAFRVAQSAHRNTDAAAAFPSVYTGCHWGNCTRGTNLPMRVDHVRSARSSWQISADAPGIWHASYDIWFHTTPEINNGPDGAELMVWLDAGGGATPSGTVVARNVEVAGGTWDIWYENSSWNYIAYVRTTPTAEVRNLDLKAFMHDSVRRGYLKPSWYLSGIEAGFEIWRDGTGLRSEAFSATTEGGMTPLPLATTTASPAPTSTAAPDATGEAPEDPPVVPGKPAASGKATACTVRWDGNAWKSGLVTTLTVVNQGPALDRWEVTWSFAGDERVGTDWGAEITQNGRKVVARNAPYNAAALGSGATVNFGFQATHNSKPKPPAEFRLNGTPCATQ
jgi:hypothetical protein